MQEVTREKRISDQKTNKLLHRGRNSRYLLHEASPSSADTLSNIVESGQRTTRTHIADAHHSSTETHKPPM